MISLHTQRFNSLLDFVFNVDVFGFFFSCYFRIANAYNPEIYNHNHTRLSFILNYIFFPSLLLLVGFIFCVFFNRKSPNKNVDEKRKRERERKNAARKRQTIRKVYLDVEGLKVLSLLYIRRFYLVPKSDQIKCEQLHFGAHIEKERERETFA